MSGRIFQNVVLQFKETVNTEIGVIDSEGTVIACTELAEIGSRWSDAVEAVNGALEGCVAQGGRTYKALSGWSDRFDYAVFVLGEGAPAQTTCGMATVALNAAKSYYEEKHDKASFLKNIISDNILLSDLYIRVVALV